MAKKRKHVYVITNTKFNGEENPNARSEWDAWCLADYFYMEHYEKDEYELEENPNDEFYRGNTCLEIVPRRKRVAYKSEDGKRKYRFEMHESYSVYKMDVHGLWFEVFSTESMEEVCELFDSFNEHYYSFGWNTFYEQYMDSMGV